MMQDEVVGPYLRILCASTVLMGCAHEARMGARAPRSDPAPPVEEHEVIAVETSSPPPESTAAKPRLSQVVTLGQGTESQYADYAPTAQPPPTGQGQGVVINNNVVVQGMPAYGWSPYGYGYGYGYGRSVSRSEARYGSSSLRGDSWGSSGWEGARRTAAPGQTPGVGGNWAPVPSHGPAQMK